MSNYTPTMIAEMQSAGSFTYESASAFASEHNLSVRSVISKIKNLDLDIHPATVLPANGTKSWDPSMRERLNTAPSRA